MQKAGPSARLFNFGSFQIFLMQAVAGNKSVDAEDAEKTQREAICFDGHLTSGYWSQRKERSQRNTRGNECVKERTTRENSRKDHHSGPFSLPDLLFVQFFSATSAPLRLG